MTGEDIEIITAALAPIIKSFVAQEIESVRNELISQIEGQKIFAEDKPRMRVLAGRS